MMLIRGLATTCVNTDVHNKETIDIELQKYILIKKKAEKKKHEIQWSYSFAASVQKQSCSKIMVITF